VKNFDHMSPGVQSWDKGEDMGNSELAYGLHKCPAKVNVLKSWFPVHSAIRKWRDPGDTGPVPGS
jgi:hypothetical protein